MALGCWEDSVTVMGTPEQVRAIYHALVELDSRLRWVHDPGTPLGKHRNMLGVIDALEARSLTIDSLSEAPVLYYGSGSWPPAGTRVVSEFEFFSIIVNHPKLTPSGKNSYRTSPERKRGKQ